MTRRIRWGRGRWLGLLIAWAWLLSACAGSSPASSQKAPASPSFEGDAAAADVAGMPAPAPPASMEGGFGADEAAEPQKSAEDRPGLATQWGETMQSSISTSPFKRGNPSEPFGLASLFYNDEAGANAMASADGFSRFSDGRIKMASGVITVGLRDESGRFLSGFQSGDKSYIVGEAGRRYTIVIQSHAPRRVEVVVSVDGLDVLDGKPASFKKRGYLIDSRGRLEIEGFRQSMDTVAAFRFGSVSESYAEQKHGDARNVGVIGIALFHEQGDNPLPWTQGEVDQRHDANPFPGQFATPP